MNNIRYGDTTASDEQVIAAAEAACIHEAISTRFPKVRGLFGEDKVSEIPPIPYVNT